MFRYWLLFLLALAGTPALADPARQRELIERLCEAPLPATSWPAECSAPPEWRTLLVENLLHQNDWRRAQLELPGVDGAARHYWTGMVLVGQERWLEALDRLRLSDRDKDGDEKTAREIVDLEKALGASWSLDQEEPAGPIARLAYGRWLVDHRPDSACGYRLQAEALAELGRGSEAWPFLHKSWQRAGATRLTARAYRMATAGRIHGRLGHLGKAAALHEHCRPKSYPADSLIIAAKLWLKAGELEAAERCLRQACLRPEVFLDEAMGLLGSSLRSQERYTEARGCFVAALGIDAEKDEAFLAALKDLDDTQAFLAAHAPPHSVWLLAR